METKSTSPDPSPRRVCLVTGGTSGIGQAVVHRLAEAGCDVVFTGRNAPRGERICRQLARHHPKQSFNFIACDLSSLPSVRRLAEQVARTRTRLDVLINNAGSRIDSYQETDDGLEAMFATNHLGHFLLTALLLDRLLAAPAARIMTVSSRRHRFVKRTHPWSETREGFERWEVYSRSKLANALFAFELARRLENTPAVSHAVDPGIVASNFSRNNGWLPWAKHIVTSLLNRSLVSSRTAAETVIHAATAPAAAVRNGKYYHEKKEIPPALVAQDQELAAELWTASVNWAGLNAGNCPAWTIVAPRPAARHADSEPR